MANADTQRSLMITSYMADEHVAKTWLALRPQAYAALRPGEFDPILDLIDVHLELWTKAVETEFGLSGDGSAARRAEIHQPADAAFAKLRETPPTTLAGARAIIEYLVAWDSDCVPETSGEYLQTLLGSPIFDVPRLTAAASASAHSA
jgi:hypothetical protein